LDYFAKTVTLQWLEKKTIVFRLEENVMSSCTILVMIVKKLLKKERMAYFTHALEIENKGIELSDIPIVREFPE